ncbi:MAG: cytochrome P450 [Acidimicrobiales bacterium]|nr:cytochrome P450 [Acidimicrobiales bacterium]
MAGAFHGPLHTPEFHHDPFPTYRLLRDDHPTFHDAERDTYVLTRFADVIEAARDHGVFSSHDPHPDVHDRMTRMDPPRHDVWRRFTSDRFRPRAIGRLESQIRDIARLLVTGLIEPDGAPVDAVSGFAAPIPSNVIGDLIGVPREHNARLHTLSETSIAGGSPAASEELRRAAAVANQEVYDLFDPLIRQRRHEPGDDLISVLVAVEVEGAPLTREQLLGYCLHLVVAGNDTTANLISNGILQLARHPDVRRRLVENPSLIPRAVEELLRYEGPVQMLPRTATSDVHLHGVTIPAGAPVELYWGAANRDDRQFDRPDDFDIDRPDERHLGFGHGAHFCLGAHLARLEARVAIEELLRRVPEYEIAAEDDLAYKPGWAIRGLDRLLVVPRP